MAITLATGVQVEIAKTYGSDITITGISNANPAVATTSAPHGLSAGSYIEVTSGWDLLTQKIVRVGAGSSGTTLNLEGIDTLSTAKYTASGGAGKCRAVTAWTQVTQLKSLSASGGDQQFADVTSLVDRVAKQVPTTRSAVTMTIDAYDDPSLTWYADVTTASDASTPYGLKMSFANGSKLVANAYWSLQKVPSVNQNEAMTSQISLSYAAEPVRYST